MFQTNQGQKNADISKSRWGEVVNLYLLNRLGEEYRYRQQNFKGGEPLKNRMRGKNLTTWGTKM